MKQDFIRSLLVVLVVLVFSFGCRVAKETQIEVVKLLETSESWNGMELPYYPNDRPEITILKVTIPPKSKLELHKHPVVTAGIVTKGELTVITEFQDTLVISEGTAVAEVVNTWHYGANNGAVPVEIIVFYAGVEGIDNTILKIEEFNPPE